MGSYVATLIATLMGCHGACKQQHCHVRNPTKIQQLPQRISFQPNGLV